MKQPEAKSRSTLKQMITFDDSRLVVLEIKKGHEKPVLLYYLSPDTSPDALLKLNSRRISISLNSIGLAI